LSEEMCSAATLANVKDPRRSMLPSTFDVAGNIAAILYGLQHELPEGWVGLIRSWW